MSNFLDANTPQMFTSAAGIATATGQFKGLLGQAQATAAQAQAMHQGESSLAFQQAHARFVAGAEKLQMLADIASNNVQEGGTTYVAGDAQGADEILSVPIADAGDISIRA